MIDTQIVLQILWTGLATSTYAVLFATAFALVLKVVKVWNFAQAGLMGIAFYSMYFAVRTLGLPGYAAVAVGLACTIAAAMALEVCGLQTFRRRNSPSLTFFIFTMVVSEFVQYTLAMIFGTEPVSLATTLISPAHVVGGIMITERDLIAIAVTVVLMAGLYMVLMRTHQGKYMLAVADNPQLSRLYGINVKRIYALTFVVASALICGGMYLFGTRAALVPTTPMEMMIFSVIAALLGGMGNVFGAAIAAIALTLLRSFSILVIPSAWQGVVLYALLFITILFFPKGVSLKRRARPTPARSTPPLAKS
jgi:branched-chain amino acid transport system permease protein